MNVRVPKVGVRERLYAYCLALNKQNNILEQMTQMVSSMRVIGKNGLLPFQKDILQSNNALKLLLDDLRQQYKINYVLNYRLNQDVLENLFGVIRSKGGLHDHPDRQEFKYRLRSYILGHNEGTFTEEGNVEVDNIPDLEGNYLSLTGNIFQRVSVDLNSTDPIEKNDDLEILNENLRIWQCTSATNSVNTTPKFVPIQKIVRLRNDQLQRVSELHRSYDALQYPILHWKGDNGYNINIPMIDPRTEDILMRMRHQARNPDLLITSEMYNEALIIIEDMCLRIANKTLVQLGMTAPNRDMHDLFDR
ncbi:uncharacterized protein LOC120780084 [Bactrocera tryoni]|uniref:uncharacterized protein LOC120780084 n=1 Tax=Bactrocera tryoni TaxID=59916 RepID=UPI001A9565FF|nr:uncharacterized protein LOC120780084 [Bactrocera tryoni]